MATYGFKVKFDVTADPPLTITPKNVQVAPDELSLITFTLDGESTQDARFPSTPVQWMNAPPPHGLPVDLPPWFVMHRHSDVFFALWDFNSTPESSDHNFHVSVFYQGQFYTSHDPVLVNEPPSGG
jgi:hypothetical protein